MLKEKFIQVSERRICKVLGLSRSTKRYKRIISAEETRLREQIIALASKYGRYGYRRITALLRAQGWQVNHKRVQRIWRQEGLKVPQKQPKRERLWLTDGSCIRLRPERPNHVWSYDFLMDRTRDGRPLKIMAVMDEYTRECLELKAARHINSDNVVDSLFKLFFKHGIPEHIRSDNGPEFISKKVQRWLKVSEVKALFIEPGSPWENGYIESFNGKLRDEFLNREIFDTLLETRILLERWRREYNTIRPHSSLGYLPPAPVTIQTVKGDSSFSLT